MTIDYIPPGELWFPDPMQASSDGLLAFGGDLSLKRLVESYARGIFPWYGPGDPILWWSPDPRLILVPDDLHISKSLRRVLNRGEFEVTADEAFGSVILGCADTPRSDGPGTWLVPEMIRAYTQLHQAGWAHSFEAWKDGDLVGGLYGVAIGRVFFGESMFHRCSDASKVAFVHCVRLLREWGFRLIDCQQTTHHLLRFGAKEVPRSKFLAMLARLRQEPPNESAWDVSDGFHVLQS